MISAAKIFKGVKTLTFPPANTFLLWGIGVTIHWSYLHGNYFGKLKRCDDFYFKN